MADVFLLPREISLRGNAFKRKHYHNGTCSMSISGDDMSSSYVSSLENSGLLRGLESGFESFTDFLEYSATPTQTKPWRRRRKYLRMKNLRKGLWLASRWLQGGFQGFCRLAVFSLVNVGVAISFILFLVF